jgi:hypothetical protein
MAEGSEVVLVVSDTHFPVHHPDVFDFLSDLKKEFSPTKIIHIGDEVEFAGMSFHDHDPDARSPGDEYREAYKCMQKLFKLFPVINFCVSNHGSRLYRKAYSAGIPRAMVKQYQQLWDAPDTAVWHRRIVVDDVMYFHGDPYSGRNAAFKAMTECHRSVVQGHTHSFGGVQYSAFEGKAGVETFFALNVGCMIDMKNTAFDYAWKYRNKPTIGCGIVIEGIHGQFIRMPT